MTSKKKETITTEAIVTTCRCLDDLHQLKNLTVPFESRSFKTQYKRCHVPWLEIPCPGLRSVHKHPSWNNGLRYHGGFRMQIGETTKAGFPPFPAYHAPPFPQRLRWSPANLLHSPLNPRALTFAKGAGQSFNSVTTNAVNDFVFRRPSVLALFEPSRTQEGRRCDTPTPFAENQDTDTDVCHCSIVSDQESFPRETISRK
ncbi:uncharacterized protein TNIN_314711 [Trichonephila inaurata madagascariensis]|uniref:Uncharacterized protein n=1 Tax=Trichonephila inaurata madagascariensis TaxID=2747483 RepID=A0A8X7CCN7_9ARAC|nr:uncharacterized protein TNIN_314711 [Trichonephila inaurata madagascariensis]